jgi:hypothetical protein
MIFRAEAMLLLSIVINHLVYHTNNHTLLKRLPPEKPQNSANDFIGRLSLTTTSNYLNLIQSFTKIGRLMS